MMNTCGTCKYFGEPVENDGWGGYDIAAPGRFHICGLLKSLNHFKPEKRATAKDAAAVMDGSGYFAALCVSDEFGCNQWAAATSATPHPQQSGTTEGLQPPVEVRPAG